MNNLPIIVALTGASGAIYGIRTLQISNEIGIPTILLISRAALITLKQETNITPEELQSLATYFYSYKDITAPISSGSYKTRGMIIAPCSAKSLASIANGFEENLISRAASVTLKERKKLVVLFREAPLHLAHIENMAKVTKMGGLIFPPVPAFYNNPSNLHDVVDYTIYRTLDQFDIDCGTIKRWHGITKS
ncbi:MAG: aromatic acid decarboxylase [Rickettsiaceae bacterium]|jgi:4-hydroxy-3-polyprenylbenzoate decarboxylase|nr:aromatic acid decarboxylase [Rickettsiaceae bacterium]